MKIHEYITNKKVVYGNTKKRTAIAEGKEQLALCIETIACTGIQISEIKYFTVERVKVGKIEIYNKGKYRKDFSAEDIIKETSFLLS